MKGKPTINTFGEAFHRYRRGFIRTKMFIPLQLYALLEILTIYIFRYVGLSYLITELNGYLTIDIIAADVLLLLILPLSLCYECYE